MVRPSLASPILYGAVTTGDIWKFGLLYREEKRIVQDINLYRVPADLEELLGILVNILKNTQPSPWPNYSSRVNSRVSEMGISG
ncbi:MAG: hypothetical protein AAGC54_06310 [Cyanobacteria bacterium P01_F01_bin.4]